MLYDLVWQGEFHRNTLWLFTHTPYDVTRNLWYRRVMVEEYPSMLMKALSSDALLEEGYTWLCRQQKGWPNEGLLLNLISLLPMKPIEPVERGREFLRFEIDSLISSGVPVQVWNRPIPFAQFPRPHPTMERQASPIRETWAGQTQLTG